VPGEFQFPRNEKAAKTRLPNDRLNRRVKDVDLRERETLHSLGSQIATIRRLRMRLGDVEQRRDRQACVRRLTLIKCLRLDERRQPVVDGESLAAARRSCSRTRACARAYFQTHEEAAHASPRGPSVQLATYGCINYLVSYTHESLAGISGRPPAGGSPPVKSAYN